MMAMSAAQDEGAEMATDNLGSPLSSTNKKGGMEGGTDTQLVRVKGAQLYLVDREESVLMQSGDFLLMFMRHLESSLAALVALVKDVEWPIGKDSPVIKVGDFSYTFALPGLIYGLILPDSTPVHSLHKFEETMKHLSTFESHVEIGGPTRQEMAERYWNALASRVDAVSRQMRKKVCQGGDNIVSYLSSSSSREAEAAAADEMILRKGRSQSNRMARRVQQVRRMSAVSKLLSKSLLKGAITKSRHVANSWAAPKDSGKKTGVAIASVDAFAKVVEAVEGGGGSSLMSEGGNKEMENEESIKNAWTLNKVGLRMLMAAIAAMTAAAAHTLPPSSAPVSAPAPPPPLRIDPSPEKWLLPPQNGSKALLSSPRSAARRASSPVALRLFDKKPFRLHDIE